MKFVKIINEFIRNLTMEANDVSIKLEDGGFNVVIELSFIIPIEDALILNELGNRLYDEFRKEGYEADKPFNIEVRGGGLCFNAEFYEVQKEVE